MSPHDRNNRPYLRLSDLGPNTVVEFDNGFSCLRPYSRQLVNYDDDGAFVFCDEGKHYLHGQADDGEHCIGVYKV